MKVTLAIFTLNEYENMKIIMPQIKKEWYDELIIVDGGSTDGTIEYAKENGYNIFVQKEKGTGAAFFELMEKVTGDITIPFSPDGNSLPDCFPVLVEKMKEGWDIVICSRYLDKAKSLDDNIMTSFGNWFFTTMVRILFRVHITDLLVMYRSFKTSLVKDLKLCTSTNAWGTQLLLRSIKSGKKITEIPGDEPARLHGETKIQRWECGYNELRMILYEFFNK